VAIVGPSGAGKTSLLRLLNGTLHPDKGQALVEGQDLCRLDRSSLRAARARMGFVHQDHALVPILRAGQNVIAGCLGQRGLWASTRALLWPARADLTRAHALLERVGIGDKLFQRTDTLSGGQQQRVAIARALFQEPTVLLADEPVASVDPARGRALLELMTELARERDLTLIASLHDLDLARDLFPRLVGLREGRVVIDAAPGEVAADAFEELYALEGLRGGDVG
jgi:phosphonate transport system ATP-binding protein